MSKHRLSSIHLEEYVFGTIALRDTIKQHKKEKTKWPLKKSIGIRLFYCYSLIVSLGMIVYYLTAQIVGEIIERIKK